MNSGGTLEDIARTIADKMKLDVNQLRLRGRENDQSKFRKIFAALANRVFGFSVAEIARFLEAGSSSVSRMLDSGRRYAGMMELSIKQ
jgi:chromosomal replication initiation ATPase DnaA